MVVERLSFDSFGKRRQANWISLDEVSLFSAPTTTRGFTFHEMVDPVGLVHMNGRVYDPELGRFLSADPFVQDASNLQSLNRYSYVLNNPLSLTDPTGFFFGSIFKAIGAVFSNIFSAITSAVKSVLNKVPILRTGLQIIACGVGIIACVAAAGVLSLASGGSLGDALGAMAMSAFSIGVWQEVGAFLEPFKALGAGGFAVMKGTVHGAVGGAMAVLQGGTFHDGFLSASIGAVAGIMSGQSSLGGIGGMQGPTIRAMIAGAAGGVASVLTGGKFANGAVTAAFAHLWNAEGGNRRGRLLLLDLAVTAIGKLYENDFMIGPWRSVQFEGRTIYVRDDLIDPTFF
jgi:RHS repeat-associated protein